MTTEAYDYATVQALDHAIDIYSKLIKAQAQAERDWDWVAANVVADREHRVTEQIRCDYWNAVLDARRERNQWALGHQHLAPLIESMYTKGG
jgi:hypothetical protein